MKGTLLVSSPNVRVLDELPLDHCPDNHELQRHLGGGWLEQVPGFNTVATRGQLHRCIAFSDEDGKMKGLPRNHYATVLWKLAWKRTKPDLELPSFLVGPVLIIYGDDELMSNL